MESSHRKNRIPPSCPTGQEKVTSDSVGSHLRDKEISDHAKSLNSARIPKKKIKYKQINYIATHNINSMLQVGRLKILTDEFNRQNIMIAGLQEMRNTSKQPFESQGYRIYNGIPGQRAIKQCPQFGTRVYSKFEDNRFYNRFQRPLTKNSNPGPKDDK